MNGKPREKEYTGFQIRITEKWMVNRRLMFFYSRREKKNHKNMAFIQNDLYKSCTSN